MHRHAQATRAEVELAVAGGTLQVVVRDDGRGFALGQPGPSALPGAPGQPQAGLGLNAIAARVGQVGGDWRLDSAPGRGTTLVARFPLVAVAEAKANAGATGDTGATTGAG